jgi:biotin carboxyl carrier protein
MRRVLSGMAAVAVALVALIVVLSGGGGESKKTAATAPRAVTDPPAAELPPLKPHPRVVIAAAPGQLPPGAQFADATTEGQQVQPPSDAEVRRELRQLQSANVGSGAYVDPFSHISGLVPERIDMGVDYQGTGPVLALGSGTVFNTAGAGWPGGYFIGITLDSGPFAGLSYFVAEDVKPAVKVGDHVRAGQVIGVMYGGPAGIETGWAAGRGDQPLAAALGQQAGGDPGGWTSAAGASFDRVLVSTGTPSGIPQGPKVHGKMPRPYP